MTTICSRPVLLTLGVLLSLFTVRTSYDLPLAAWLFLIPLLLWNRGGRRWWPNALVLSALTMVQVVVFLLAAHLPDPAMALVMLVFVPAQVLPFLLDRWAAHRLPALASSLVYPTARVAAELAIGTLWPLGTAFGVLGYSQHGNLPLLQLAGVTGVYGISFVVAWFGSGAATLIARRRDLPQVSRRALVVPLAAVLVGVHVAGAVRLATIEPTSTTRVAMISPDPALVKRLDEMQPQVAATEVGRVDRAVLQPLLTPINDQLLELTAREAAGGARLVTWSEGAALVQGTADLDGLLGRVGQVARTHRVSVLVGVGVFLDREPYIQNQAILVQADGTVAWRYDKAHPIPLMNPYPAGDGTVPITETDAGRIASIICFDSDFPQTSRRASGADLLVIPVLDWDGIQHWHATNAPFRAVEAGVTVVRPAMEGIHGAVDPAGRWVERQDAVHAPGPTVTVADVPVGGNRTVYATVGDAFAMLCTTYAAAVGVLLVVRRRTRR